MEEKVVIVKKSPYETLDDVETIMLTKLRQHYMLLGPTSELEKFFYAILQELLDPYTTVIKFIVCSGDFHACKQKSLSLFVIVTFGEWLKLRQDRIEASLDVKMDALHIIMKHKYSTMRQQVMTVFNMKADKEHFVPVIRDLIKNKNYKDACEVARVLELHQKFSCGDFLFPLFLQDKQSFIDDYLRGNKESLLELLNYLDSLLIGDTFTNVNDIILKNDIKGVKVRRHDHRPLSKLMLRLIKKNNLSMHTFPNLTKRRQMSAINYLLCQRGNEKMSSESWAEMVQEAAGDVAEVQLQLVEALSNAGELQEALKWARHYNISTELWPSFLLEHSLREDKPEFKTCAAGVLPKEENYYTLPESMIIIVDSAELFKRFLEAIKNANVVGIDAEWKPKFGVKENALALIQVATPTEVYILDRPSLSACYPSFTAEVVSKLFHSKSLLKVGFDLQADFKPLKTALPDLREISPLLDLRNFRTALIEINNIKFPCSSNEANVMEGEKLKDLVKLCLGVKLDKREQCSNWERRPLRPSQVQYAACDAYCLLEIYDVIKSECINQNKSFDKVTRDFDHSAASASPVKASENMKTVKDLHFICTWELCRLPKRLRRCGIDVSYNGYKGPTKQTLKLARQNYVVLSTVPQRWLTSRMKSLNVPIAQEKVQLQFVLSSFAVEVMPEDFNTRCTECNNTDITVMPGEDLRKLRADADLQSRVVLNSLPAEESDYSNDDDDDCDDEPIFSACQIPATQSDVRSRWTPLGAAIKSELVPSSVANNYDTFYLCASCGNVMWPTTLDEMFLHD